MKTSKMLGYIVALLLLISVSSCGPTYYTNRSVNSYGRRHHGPPPRPYGGYRGYGYGNYGRSGW
ncbi:hypothetical protein [Spirosoma aerophilum]